MSTSTTAKAAAALAPSLATPMATKVHTWLARWARRGGRMREIRGRMLAQLGTVPACAAAGRLAGDIGSATEPNTLWALRGELNGLLVRAHGPAVARQKATDISFLFAGVLPASRDRDLYSVDASSRHRPMQLAPVNCIK